VRLTARDRSALPGTHEPKPATLTEPKSGTMRRRRRARLLRLDANPPGRTARLSRCVCGRRLPHSSLPVQTRMVFGTGVARWEPVCNLERSATHARYRRDVLLNRLREWNVGKPSDTRETGSRLLAAWQRADDKPSSCRPDTRRCGVRAVGFPPSLGEVGVCVATSGPGAIHLLNGLYDAKLDHVPAGCDRRADQRSAMAGPTSRRWTLQPVQGRSAASKCRLHVPSHVSLIAGAIRIALRQDVRPASSFPPNVFDLEYEAPGHVFKQVPSAWPE